LKKYKIYKIIIENEIRYIGCTSQSLNKRLYQHSTDNNSQVYKNVFAKNLNPEIYIKEIPIKYKQNGVYIDLPYITAYKYEEILTYVYGINNNLFNDNAGNIFYDNLNDLEVYTHIHSLLYDLLNNIIDINVSDLSEILIIVNNKFENIFSPQEINLATHDISSQNIKRILNNFNDLCTEKICDVNLFDL
jgi:hypothetical protein